MMGLFDEIQQAGKPRRASCVVAGLLTSLPDADAADLVLAFNDPSIANTSILTVLTGRGLHVGAHSLARHRRGRCTCVDS